jgi:phage/plasmid-like protein (TIGR03299 family)
MTITIEEVFPGREFQPANDTRPALRPLGSPIVIPAPAAPPATPRPPAGGFGMVGEDAERVLGPAKTAADMVRLAGLGWTVRKEATRYADGRASEESFHILREDTGAELGVVSAGYGVAQNAEVFAVLDPLTSAGLASYMGAGGFDGGKTVFAQVALNMTAEVVPGDVVASTLAVKGGHAGASGVRGAQTMVRAVCRNTLAKAMKGVRMFDARHTRNVQRALLEARAVVEELSAAWLRQLEECRALAKRQMQTAEIVSLLKELIPDPKEASAKLARENRERERDEIMALLESGRGTDIPGVRGTAWGVLNAVTEWHDHVRTARQSAEARTQNTLFGEAAALKADAYQRILQTLDA